MTPSRPGRERNLKFTTATLGCQSAGAARPAEPTRSPGRTRAVRSRRRAAARPRRRGRGVVRRGEPGHRGSGSRRPCRPMECAGVARGSPTGIPATDLCLRTRPAARRGARRPGDRAGVRRGNSARGGGSPLPRPAPSRERSRVQRPDRPPPAAPSTTRSRYSGTRAVQPSVSSMRRRSASAASGSPWTTKTSRGGRSK